MVPLSCGRDRSPSEHEQQHQRWELLRRLDRLTNVPMTLLAFVWLALLIVDLTPSGRPSAT
ncbi:hypothetical protein ACFSC4_21245 [Deinococcus malanensis]|uniref:hypothetical protein n=1 Tax=Deinococcus malanensis TaxID=1706855 RepID=UPI0036256FC8